MWKLDSCSVHYDFHTPPYIWLYLFGNNDLRVLWELFFMYFCVMLFTKEVFNWTSLFLIVFEIWIKTVSVRSALFLWAAPRKSMRGCDGHNRGPSILAIPVASFISSLLHHVRHHYFVHDREKWVLPALSLCQQIQQTSVLFYDQNQVSQTSLAKMLRESLHGHGENDDLIHSDTDLDSTMCQPQGYLLTYLDDLWKFASFSGPHHEVEGLQMEIL